MTNAQRNRIQAILVDSGLTFTPLLDEMTDHIGCDVELLMDSGASFEEALRQTLDEIPTGHFSDIQRDTLLVIDKRFTASKSLSYLTIATLLLALLFKVLHLQFSDALLILSFILIATTMLTGSFSGWSLMGRKYGIARLMLTLTGVILLQVGYAFKVLHLPGAEIIIVLATAITVTALLSNTYAVFQHAPGRETMLTFLHEKYTQSIERFLLILLLVMTAVKVATITTSLQVPGAPLILLIIIFGSGLHFIAFTWRILEQQVHFKRTIFAIGIAIASLCLVLPFLGEILQWEIRVVAITLFTAISAWLAFRMQLHPQNVLSSIAVLLMPLLFVMWAMLKLQLVPQELHPYVFNLPVMGLLTTGLLLSMKHDTVRSYLIIALSAYLVEYSI